VLVQELLAAGALGRVTGVRYHWATPAHRETGSLWRLDATKAGGGLFLDVGSHVLDLLDFLLGPLTDIASTAANLASSHPVEDTVAMSFRTGSGTPGTAHWNFASALHDDQLELRGTEGRLNFSVLGNEPVRLETAADVQLFDRPNPPHVQQPLIQAVVDDLLGGAACPSTGESARRTSQVMDRVLADYYGGRADEFWARPETWPGRRRS
jgi:predicted dehydrogenase